MAEKKKGITVTHLNIRPSISLLIGQLVFLNLLSAAIITVGYLIILNSPLLVDEVLKSLTGLVLLLMVFAFEIFLTIYAVLQWINDFYELTPTFIAHRKGLINRRIERYALDNLMYLNMEQGFLGSIFNYGTLTFLSPRREKLLELYSIHNPNKYLEVIESIKPTFGEVKDVLRGAVSEDGDLD